MHKKDAQTSILILENPSQTTNWCERNIENEDKCCSESLKELRQKIWTFPSQLN